MGVGCDGVELGPGEQLVRRNQAFGHGSGLAGGDLHRLPEFVRMGEEKLQIEAPSSIEERDGLFQVRSFARIGPALVSR